MKDFQKLPKNIKKTVRYINQDASYDQLMLIKKYVKQAIERKEKELYRKK